MAPTIVDGGPNGDLIAIGGSGGSRIFGAVAQVRCLEEVRHCARRAPLASALWRLLLRAAARSLPLDCLSVCAHSRLATRAVMLITIRRER